ncbi:MAG: ankyrin repeat domain-containing protein [Rickettsiales bacterium]|nr:ankyrin repeat domain-containing protein [Rickettsiales bacterium]
MALEQPNPNREIIQLLLESNLDIKYTYDNPLNKIKSTRDNYLHIAARAGNKETFVTICKKQIADVTVHNEYGNNPFHEAAKSKILLPAVKEILHDLEKDADKKIKKAEEAGNRKEVGRLKEELKCNKKYIKDAFCSKDYAFNEKRKTPLYYLNAAEQKEIKQIAGIKDSLICNQKFHLCLYIVGAIACIAALCLSLYFLYLSSQTFALSSIIAIASGGVTYLSVKACSEIHDLHNESALVEDPRVARLSEEMLASV